MAPKKTKQAPRQRIDYRAGWSMEEPIVIDGIEEASKDKVFTKSYTVQNSGPGYRPYFSSLAGGAKLVNPAQVCTIPLTTSLLTKSFLTIHKSTQITR